MVAGTRIISVKTCLSFFFFIYFFFRWVPPPTSCHRFGSGESVKNRGRKKIKKIRVTQKFDCKQTTEGRTHSTRFFESFFLSSFLLLLLVWQLLIVPIEPMHPTQQPSSPHTLTLLRSRTYLTPLPTPTLAWRYSISNSRPEAPSPFGPNPPRLGFLYNPPPPPRSVFSFFSLSLSPLSA